MSNPHRERWAGALVSDRGQVVLLRGVTGTLFYPDPEDAVPPVTVPFLYSDDTPVFYTDDSPVEYAS